MIMARAIKRSSGRFGLMAPGIKKPGSGFVAVARATTYPQPSFTLVAGPPRKQEASFGWAAGTCIEVNTMGQEPVPGPSFESSLERAWKMILDDRNHFPRFVPA